MIDAEKARRLCSAFQWHHDWEIVPGVRTNGSYNPSEMFKNLQLPDDMRGMTVADVGASNGFFSFACQDRGAKVVAFDYRHADNSGFALAEHIRGSPEIPHFQVNVLRMTPDTYGKFDVVLCLGILYHTADPYKALSNCAALSRDRLLVESYCIDSLEENYPKGPVMRFMPDSGRWRMPGLNNSDNSNFWCLSAECLRLMLLDLGFKATRNMTQGDRVLMDSTLAGAPERNSLAYGLMGHTPMKGDPGDPGSWRII